MTYPSLQPEEEFQVWTFENYADEDPGRRFMIEFADGESYICLFDTAYDSENGGEFTIEMDHPKYDEFHHVSREIIETIQWGLRLYRRETCTAPGLNAVQGLAGSCPPKAGGGGVRRGARVAGVPTGCRVPSAHERTRAQGPAAGQRIGPQGRTCGRGRCQCCGGFPGCAGPPTADGPGAS